MGDEPNYPSMPTIADLAANPPTREELAATATAPPRIYPVREPLPPREAKGDDQC